MRPAPPARRPIVALWATLGLLALSLTGCPGRHTRPDDFSEDPAPLLAAVRARNAQVRSLTGELKLEVWRGSERVRLTQLFAVQAPDRLRLSVLTPFGQELSVLVSDGQTLSIWAQDERRFYRGEANAKNLSRLVPVPLAPDALGALLRGSVPLMAEPERQTVTWDAENGWVVLTLTRDDAEERISFEPAHTRVTALRLRQAGRTVLSARLGQYDGTDARQAMPRRLRLEAPTIDTRIDVDVAEVTVNPELPAEAFQLSPPRGIEVEPL